MATKAAARRERPFHPSQIQIDQFAGLLHTMTLRFADIQKEIRADNTHLREEWRSARGLSTLTERRLEILEARMRSLEGHIGAPPDPEVEAERALMANWAQCAEDVGVHPLRGSMIGH